MLVRKLLRGQGHLDPTTVVLASFCYSCALDVLMHCAHIILTAMLDTVFSLACRSDANDALLSHLVH